MKLIIRHVSLIVATILLAAAPLDSSAAPRHSGIAGRVHVFTGPIWDGPPRLVIPMNVTSFPIATTFTVLSSRSGRVVAHGSSDANGDFSVALRPGRYIIVPADLPETLFCSFETPEPFEVTVRPHRVSGAGFTYIGECHGIIGILTP